jgi:competence protein ComEC
MTLLAHELAAARAAVAETLRYRPIVWLAVSLVAGVVAADLLPPNPWAWYGAGVLAVVVSVVALGEAGHRVPVHVPLALLIACLGGAIHSQRLAIGPDDVSRHIGETGAQVIGTVADSPHSGAHWTLFPLQVASVDGAAVSGSASVLSRAVVDVEPGQVVRLDAAAISLLESKAGRGSADPVKAALRRGIHADIACRGVAVVAPAQPGRLGRLGEILRRRTLLALRRAMPGGQTDADLLAAMVIGAQAAELSPDTLDEFRRSGTVHLLVVSGAQVTMLVGAVLLLTSAGYRHPRWWHFLPAIPLTLALAVTVGPGASVLRAIVMGALWCAGVIARRSYDSATAIAFAGIVVGLTDTSALFSPGIQLTFAATVGVIIAVPRAERDDFGRLHRVPTWAYAVSGTLGAWLLSTPLLAFHFGCFTGVGSLANVIAVPLSALIMPVGMLTICLGLAHWTAAIPGCWVCKGLIHLMLVSNAWFGSLPGAFVDHVQFPVWACVIWYIGAFAVIWLYKTRVPQTWWRFDPMWALIAGAAMVACVVLCRSIGSAAIDKDLTVAALSVGAGQCVVISGPNGNALIDAGSTSETQGLGPQMAEAVALPYLRRHHIAPIHAIVVSHPHADHCSAVPEIVDSWPVLGLWLPRDVEPGMLESVARRMEAKQALWRIGTGDGCPQIGLRVVGPARHYEGRDEAAANDNALVVALEYGRVRFLFPADAQTRAQSDLAALARRGLADLRADVFVAPHHGRKSAVCQDFVRAVHPRYVVISTGTSGNGIDTVSPDFLRIAAETGARVLRTDQAGTITFRTDGETLDVRTER